MHSVELGNSSRTSLQELHKIKRLKIPLKTIKMQVIQYILSTRCFSSTNYEFTYIYAPEIEDRGAYCFCLVCHSKILSSLKLQPC